jgi:hypothetical protein
VSTRRAGAGGVPGSPAASGVDPALAIAATRRWIEKAVIGLNLCPFAKAAYVRDAVRFVVSEARSDDALLADLQRELQALAAAPAGEIETTVLIHPHVLQRFDDYIRFLGVAEAAVAALGLEGVLQVASFHPHYRFAGTRDDDVGNNTNRSPWPTLHLLREASIDAAVRAFPDPASIYRRNLETMQRLGREGWERLDVAGGLDAGRPAAREPAAGRAQRGWARRGSARSR